MKRAKCVLCGKPCHEAVWHCSERCRDLYDEKLFRIQAIEDEYERISNRRINQ